MKVFWVCNVEIPIVSKYRGKKPSSFGGWLDETSRFVSRTNQLTICYMTDKECSGSFDNVVFYGFTEGDSRRVLKKAIANKEYDIYHLWGTEYEHSLHLVEILEKIKVLDKCVVSIQGIISVCATHYADGLPFSVKMAKNLRDLRGCGSVYDRVRHFVQAGEREKKVLKKVKNVIGRTEWDKACIFQINPSIHYYFCNECLRKCFYGPQWDIKEINRKTVFVSQCNYPIKGMHYLLEALPLVKERIPDIKVITTGNSILEIGQKYRRMDSYKRYLHDLIYKYKLNENIEFRGVLSGEEMVNEYLRANLFVSPSSIENSSNSIGEAMLIGCPVVASYVGGNMTMLENGKEGYLYQANSREMLAHYIIKIITNDELACKLSANSQIKALKTHDIDENNKRLLQIYEKIIVNDSKSHNREYEHLDATLSRDRSHK